MTEEEFAKYTQDTFQTKDLDICSGWKGYFDVEGKIHNVFFQIYAEREEGIRVLEASTHSRQVKILTNEDIDQYLGILFYEIAKKQSFETALNWANSINIREIYKWFQTADDIFRGKTKIVDWA